MANQPRAVGQISGDVTKRRDGLFTCTLRIVGFTIGEMEEILDRIEPGMAATWLRPWMTPKKERT